MTAVGQNLFICHCLHFFIDECVNKTGNESHSFLFKKSFFLSKKLQSQSIRIHFSRSLKYLVQFENGFQITIFKYKVGCSGLVNRVLSSGDRVQGFKSLPCKMFFFHWLFSSSSFSSPWFYSVSGVSHVVLL